MIGCSVELVLDELLFVVFPLVAGLLAFEEPVLVELGTFLFTLDVFELLVLGLAFEPLISVPLLPDVAGANPEPLSLLLEVVELVVPFDELVLSDAGLL